MLRDRSRTFTLLLVARDIRHDLPCVDVVGLNRLGNLSTLQNLQRAWPQVRLHSDHALDQTFQIARVDAWWVFEHALDDSFVEVVHVLGPERRMQSKCLIEHTAQAPDVTLAVVRFVVPDLRAGVIRSSRLCVEKASFGHFRDVHVAQSSSAIALQEQVRRLDIPVEHLEVMELLEAANGSYCDSPYLLLVELLLVLLELGDLLEQVTVVGEVHHDEQVRLLVNEGLLVPDDARVLDRCENAHFIECVLPFLRRKRLEGDLFQRVNFLVRFPANFEHLTERATPELF